jgi:KDO2-lipid IV(A) lauroyltransferase
VKGFRQWVEYAPLWVLLKVCGLLPRGVARSLGSGGAALSFAMRPRLRRVTEINLKIAFPEWDDAKRKQVTRGMVHQLGWMAGEFTQFPKYMRRKIEEVVQLEGLENFVAAERRGKGVLFLTGHIGAWELAPFAQARYGHPLHFLVRAVDNPRLDGLVNSYRMMCGNRPIEKNQSARAVLRALGAGETVGILADQNTMPEEGTFVDFFGVAACTTTGIARMALHTDAAVVPGYILWDAKSAKYRLKLEPAVELERSGDLERDVRENTQKFTKVIENVVRANPEQWVWVHKRWKTRPAGEKPIY